MIKEEIEIPKDIEIKIENGLVDIKGPKGSIQRKLINPKLNLKIEENKVLLSSEKVSKREKTRAGTIKAHLKNMIHGVSEGFVYKLKICSSHFPMTVSSNNNQLSVKNFLGESIPRNINIKEGVDIKIEEDIIIIDSPDKELAGQTAASVEQLCRLTNKDKRIFQDGIYMIEKAGKAIK